VNRGQGLLGRLRQGGPQDEAVLEAQRTHAKNLKDPEFLAEALNRLGPGKQLTLHELWPATEIELPNGLRVTARSKKESGRFTKPLEPEVLEWLGSLQAGDVFYDIGANCGTLTLAAAAMHGDAIKIVAIEPGYANFESLARNLSHNGMLGYVTPLQVALLDRTRLEPINYYASTAAGTSLHAVGRPVDHEDNEFTPVETQMVPAFALDELIERLDLPAPTHVKVDVDGAEGPLLEGAVATLAGGTISELMIEIVDHDRAGTRLEQTRSFLERHGFGLVDTLAHNPGSTESFVADHLFRRSASAVPKAPAAQPTAPAPGPTEPAPEKPAPAARAWLPGGRLRAARNEAARHQRAAQRSRAKLERQSTELQALRTSYYLVGARKKLDLRELDGFSDIARSVIEAGRTGMSYDRLYTLWQAVEAAPDAPAIEIGAYKGGSARFIAEALQAHDRTPAFYVCDTFQGHAQTDAEVDTAHHETGKFEDISVESTMEYLSGYPALEMVVGDIAETAAGLPEQSYGLVHLDVDVYPTTAFCLRHFAPRLAPGALMVIDDYGYTTCPGVKQAADEFVAELPEFRLWHLLTGQALLSRRS
jgi:O-methyltransferase